MVRIQWAVRLKKKLMGGLCHNQRKASRPADELQKGKA